MSEDIQNLLDKINREGIEKANAKAAEIISAAKARAEGLIADAKQEAEKAKREAEAAAACYEKRAEESIRQAARDTILKVEGAITGMLEKLLLRNVEKALGDEATASRIAADAVRELTGDAEISAAPKLVDALKAQFAGSGNVKVTLDDTLETGFSVRTDGGRIEHAFTADVIAGELAKRLRPDLAKLLK